MQHDTVTSVKTSLVCHTLQKNRKGLVKCAYKSGVIPPESGGAHFAVHSFWWGCGYTYGTNEFL